MDGRPMVFSFGKMVESDVVMMPPCGRLGLAWAGWSPLTGGRIDGPPLHYRTPRVGQTMTDWRRIDGLVAALPGSKKCAVGLMCAFPASESPVLWDTFLCLGDAI